MGEIEYNQFVGMIERMDQLCSVMTERIATMDSVIANYTNRREEKLKEPLLTQKEAADIVGVSGPTIMRARQNRRIKAVRINKSWMYNRADVLAYKDKYTNRKN